MPPPLLTFVITTAVGEAWNREAAHWVAKRVGAFVSCWLKCSTAAFMHATHDINSGAFWCRTLSTYNPLLLVEFACTPQLAMI